MKKEKIKYMKFKCKTEMCSCGDTNEQQLLIYLGTKNEKIALSRARYLVDLINLAEKQIKP